jgi:hypothetical protein
MPSTHEPVHLLEPSDLLEPPARRISSIDPLARNQLQPRHEDSSPRAGAHPHRGRPKADGVPRSNRF